MEARLTIVFTSTLSAQLTVAEIAPGFYLLLDDDVEILTPSYLGLKYKSVIIAKKLKDEILEFVAISSKKAAKRSKKTAIRNRRKKVAETGAGSSVGNFIIRLLIVIGMLLFIISALVHFSTFFQFEQPIMMSDVWMLHILIFAIFIPAIFFSSKLNKKKSGNSDDDVVSRHTPRWLKITCTVLFAYAIINFIICMVILGAGSPSEKDDKYILMQKGKFIKELAESEWKYLNVVETRAFSGHWLIFYSGAIMMLIGVLEVRRRKKSGEALIPEKISKKKKRKCLNNKTTKSPPAIVTPVSPNRIIGILSLIGYVLAIWIIFSEYPAFDLILCPILGYMGVKFWINTRKRSRQGDDSCETTLGCLSIIPNFYIAIFMAHKLGTILYTIVFAGLIPTLTCAVTFISTKSGSNMLSNGQEVNCSIWGAMPILGFPIFVLMMTGLTELMNCCARNFGKNN